MKIFVYLICCICLFYSCTERKPSNDSLPNNNSNQPQTDVTIDSNKTVLWEFKSSTDKLIKVEETKQSESLSNLIILPEGYPNTTDGFEIKGTDPISRVFTLDLNKDGFEEFYLITKAAGSGSYERIIGFASNNNLSITPVYVPKITDKDLAVNGNFSGYMGHDSIYVDKTHLYRKFPVYLEGDPNCCPSGGSTTLLYELKPGEAGWILSVKK